MTMATVQFYNNPCHYPDFKAALTPLTSQVSMTPKNTSTKGGTLHLSGEWGELSTYNYVCIRRNNQTTWAWVDTVRERGANACEVEYIVDAFRTYKDQITTGDQHLERVPFETELYDGLLGSTKQAHNLDTSFLPWANYRTRVLVVQVRRHNTVDNLSNTPGQPSPYNFYLASFDPDNWVASDPIAELMNHLLTSAQTENIVTMYTIPYIDISSLVDKSLPIRTATDNTSIGGFKYIGAMTEDPVKQYLHRSRQINLRLDKSQIFRRNHAYRVIVPDAGVLQITDEAIQLGNIKLRQDIDLYSGASNYMVTAGENDNMTGQSIRGSSVHSIPILSDPYDTYLSQNQNALSTALMGDVANVAVGVGMTATGNPLGAGQAVGGMTGLLNRQSTLRDAENTLPSNPASFLGSALLSSYGNGFWLLEQVAPVENENLVHTQFGYPYEMLGTLTIPEEGYIQTSNCSVRSSGRVPNWAIQDINNRFDNGLRVL